MKLFLHLLPMVLAVIVATNACGQPSHSNARSRGHQRSDRDLKETVNSSIDTNLLRQIQLQFHKGDLSDLDSIFSRWNRGIPPDAQGFIERNDTSRAVYDVFRTFYKPLNLLEIGNWEWGNELNADAKYIVVQKSIFYTVLPYDSIGNRSEDRPLDSIMGFRPPVDLDRSRVLYLTDSLEEAISGFLGSESTKLGEGGIMNPSRAKGNSEARYRLLRPYIPILHGHWGGYWHINTHPHVGSIIFNRKLTEARLYFRVGYQGGQADLKKNGGRWVITSSRTTWIE